MVYKVGSFFLLLCRFIWQIRRIEETHGVFRVDYEQYVICIMRAAAGFWLKPAGNCDIVNGCLYRAYICVLYAEISYI